MSARSSICRFSFFFMDFPEAEIINNKFVYNRFEIGELTANDKDSIDTTQVIDPSTTFRHVEIDFENNQSVLSSGISPENTDSIHDSYSILADSLFESLLAANNPQERKDNVDKVVFEESFINKSFAGVTLNPSRYSTILNDLFSGSIQSFESFDFVPSENSPLALAEDYLDSLDAPGLTNSLTSKEIFSKILAGVSNEGFSDVPVSFNQAIERISIGASFNKLSIFDATNQAGGTGNYFFERLANSENRFRDITDNALPTMGTNKLRLGNYFPVIEEKNIIKVEESGAHNQFNFIAKHTGYHITKFRKSDDGTIEQLDSFLTKSNKIIDPNVRYGSSYRYKIRPVYIARVPTRESISYTSNSGKISRVYFAAASRGTSIVVDCIERTPPEPPDNIEFSLEDAGLQITWDTPFNRQRDIAKFQVYRRKKIDEPFRLIYQNDFRDPRYPDFSSDLIPSEINNRSSFRETFYVDKDFDNEAIYALCSVDYHGINSGYSTQFKVERVPNGVKSTVVSFKGAIRSYPNMMLNQDFFKDTIQTSGASSVSIYFDPEYLVVKKIQKNDDGSEEVVRVMDISGEDNVEQSIPKFTMNFINVDIHKFQKLDIFIKDKTSGFLSPEEALIDDVPFNDSSG